MPQLDLQILLLVFLVQLFCLFIASKHLTISISQFIYSVTNSRRWTIYGMAVVFLPGTILHELSHAVMATLLLVPVGKIEFVPEIRIDGVKLGSVQIGDTDPLRRLLIGLAPVVFGCLLIFSILWIFLSYFIDQADLSLISAVVVVLLLFQITNTMFSSRKDMEGLLEVVVIIGSFFVAFWLMGFEFSTQIFKFMTDLGISPVIGMVNIYLLLPLVIDLIVILTLKTILKR